MCCTVNRPGPIFYRQSLSAYANVMRCTLLPAAPVASSWSSASSAGAVPVSSSALVKCAITRCRSRRACACSASDTCRGAGSEAPVNPIPPEVNPIPPEAGVDPMPPEAGVKPMPPENAPIPVAGSCLQFICSSLMTES